MTPRLAFVAPDDAASAAVAAELAAAAGGLLRWSGGAGELPPGLAALVYRPPAAAAGPDLAAAEALLAAAARSCPARLLLLSSAAAYDPRHDHPGQVGEAYRPRGRNPIARRWLALEALAARTAAGWGGRLAILRPATVVAADGGEPLARRLVARLVLSPAGWDPPLQLLAAEDLATAVRAVLEGDGEGVYHVAPRGVVPAHEAARLAGARRLPLPGPLLRRLGAASGAELAYLRHPWTVSDRRLRALGWAPRRSSAEALLAATKRQAGAPVTREHDDHGMDSAYIDAYGRTLFRFLSRAYWRIESRGLEQVPRAGAAVLAGVHRGFMPWDGVMTLDLVRKATGRVVRFLIHPCLVKQPFLATHMRKLGGVVASRENAEALLGRGELLGVYPEGIRGAFTPYRQAYRLDRFGRDEYVRTALRHGAPIVPFVTVGSAEIYPILGRLDAAWVRRRLEWPYLPLCPNFPLPGPPLPSKWHTRFLAPLDLGRRYPPEAADDPVVVRTIGREVRGRLEEAMLDMLRRRRHVFWGSVFDDAEALPLAAAEERRAS